MIMQSMSSSAKASSAEMILSRVDVITLMPIVEKAAPNNSPTVIMTRVSFLNVGA